MVFLFTDMHILVGNARNKRKVEIKDKIPEYTTYVDGSASDGGVYKDGEITWTKEKVAADETFEVTFKVKVKDDVSGA